MKVFNEAEVDLKIAFDSRVGVNIFMAKKYPTSFWPDECLIGNEKARVLIDNHATFSLSNR